MYNNYMNNYMPPRYYQGGNTPSFTPQNSTQPTQTNWGYLQGKSVESYDVVRAIDIPLDGSISYFPLVNGSAIITKQLQSDGTSKITIYEPKIEKENVKYATLDDIDKKIEEIDFCEIDDLKEELVDLKKEIKEIKTRLKNKKED